MEALEPLRDARRAVAPYLLVLMGLVGLAIGVPRTVRNLHAASVSDRFVPATAWVTHWETKRTSGRGAKHYEELEFRYEVGGETLYGDNTLTRDDDTRQSLSRLITSHGDGRPTLTVYYDPENPAIVAVSKEFSIAGTLLLLAVCLASLTAGILILRYRATKALTGSGPVPEPGDPRSAG